MAIPPLSIGVCSWSLQVTSVPELKRLLDRLGVNVLQIACGDPHHADWEEGERLPQAATAAGFQLKGTGWYATDFKNSGTKPAAKTDKAETTKDKPAATQDKPAATQDKPAENAGKKASKSEAATGGGATPAS